MRDIDNILVVLRKTLSQLKVWRGYCQLDSSLREKCGLYPIIFKFGLFFIFKHVVVDFLKKRFNFSFYLYYLCIKIKYQH
jgi:hypothetical protein